MAEALEVFKDGIHVGQFTRSASGHIRYEYDSNAEQTPISLSLPRDGSASRKAAENFLENLLPDNAGVRARWARRLQTTTSPFDLLQQTGEDVAGALSLMPEGQEPDPGSRPARPASEDEIADRVASLIDDNSAWIAPEYLGKVRMSLAGMQGKFAVAHLGRNRFWSSATLPSTHIYKPAFHKADQVPEFEAGSLALAKAAGIAAPEAWSERILGQHTYVVARFDREITGAGIRRIHTEDFAQAAGRSPQEKYGMQALSLINTLKAHAGEEDVYRFVQMLAFNTAIGNTDAHGKNYSVFLDDGVSLAPLYDSMPTSIWPEFSEDRQAMKIGGALRSQEVQAAHWVKLAQVNDLDEARVLDLARAVYQTVRERGHEEYQAVGVSEKMLKLWDSHVSSTTRHMV